MFDTNAIHGNRANEIDALTEKAVPVNGDFVIIEDSAAGNIKKKAQLGNLPAAGGADPNAIHDNVTGEIAALTEKGSPVAADLVIIEDSAAGNAKKKVQLGNLPGGSGTDADAIHDNVASEIHAVTAKGTPVAADELLIEDSADSWNKKRVALSSLPAGSGLGYTLYVGCSNSSPSDGATTYFGVTAGRGPATSTQQVRVYIPKAGTIKAAEIWGYATGAAGSNEQWDFYIRLNDTTDTLIASVSSASAGRRWSNTSLSIPVVAGDYIEIKTVNPTWATNPTTVYYGGHIYIE